MAGVEEMKDWDQFVCKRCGETYIRFNDKKGDRCVCGGRLKVIINV